jgi:leucyl aminopeptidase
VSILANGMNAEEVEHVAIGVQFGGWEYTDLKTPAPESERRDSLTSCELLVDDVKAMAGAAKAGQAIGVGYALARRLGNMPGNVCTPDTFADTARDIGKRLSMKVTVLGRKELERLKMGAFLAVAQGTPQDPKLITIEHMKGPKSQKPIVLVGKGLCFDSGGISIKPADRMEFMKFDMCGAAAVLGAMEAIGRLGLKINVVGAIGSTTNMVSGVAVKPGDIVTAASGKTIEVINTDAEGRLVLADVLHHIKQYTPSAVVDAATLTGACVVALGSVCTGAMGNDDALVQEVVAAARTATEPAWQLPLFDEYQELIRSSFADIKNIGGRGAGAITAAAFLKEFVDYPWVHLDVAGTAYTEADLPTMPVGSTGTPVGTFVEFVRRRAG